MRLVEFNLPPQIVNTGLWDYSSIDPAHTAQNVLFTSATTIGAPTGKMIALYSGALPLDDFVKPGPPPAPTNKTQLTVVELLDLIGATDFQVISNAAAGDALVFLFLAKLQFVNIIDVLDSQFIADIVHFKTQAYINQTKENEILAGIVL